MRVYKELMNEAYGRRPPSTRRRTPRSKPPHRKQNPDVEALRDKLRREFEEEKRKKAEGSVQETQQGVADDVRAAKERQEKKPYKDKISYPKGSAKKQSTRGDESGNPGIGTMRSQGMRPVRGGYVQVEEPKPKKKPTPGKPTRWEPKKHPKTGAVIPGQINPHSKEAARSRGSTGVVADSAEYEGPSIEEQLNYLYSLDEGILKKIGGAVKKVAKKVGKGIGHAMDFVAGTSLQKRAAKQYGDRKRFPKGSEDWVVPKDDPMGKPRPPRKDEDMAERLDYLKEVISKAGEKAGEHKYPSPLGIGSGAGKWKPGEGPGHGGPLSRFKGKHGEKGKGGLKLTKAGRVRLKLPPEEHPALKPMK